MKTSLVSIFLGIAGSFWTIAPVSIAQTAINSGAISDFGGSTLPLRNLLIEVRQVQSGDARQTELGSQGGVRLGTDGQVALQGELLARQRQTQQSTAAVQQVLVLNGRSADIALRSSTPLRLMQSFVRNGRVFVTQGVVFLQAGTGFAATPRWEGAEQVELTLSAQQALIPPGGTSSGATQSGTSSTLVLPLGAWTSVAQSDSSGESSARSLVGNASTSEQRSMDVQVRITLR